MAEFWIFLAFAAIVLHYSIYRATEEIRQLLSFIAATICGLWGVVIAPTPVKLLILLGAIVAERTVLQGIRWQQHRRS